MAQNTEQRLRIFIIGIFFTVFYFILIFRLASIQLKSSAEYNESIDIQCIRKVRIPAVRGRIFSSDGKVIADNKVSYNIVFHLAEMRKAGNRKNNVNYIYSWAEKLSDKINRKLDVTKTDIVRQMNLRPAMPITIFKNLTTKELAICSEISPPVPGMEIVAIPERFYPYGKIGCHFLGYTNEDDPGDAPDRREYSYYIPDVKGKSGLEKMIDSKINLGVGYKGLRGEAGSKLLRVNVKGYVHDDLGVSNMPLCGNSVVLTINWKAQEAAAKVLTDKTGSIIVLDADTGAVIAMASSPGFDPNDFTNGISWKKWKELLNDPQKPMYDRALMGVYMPGSIIKPLVALAALKDGISPEDTIFCDGAAPIGNTSIKCWAWKYGGHGYENMVNAIRDSCNVYFVETGLKVGLNRLREMYKAAGIGMKSGIGLPERSGVLPSEEYKMKTLGRKWTNFDTGLISIGQGMVTLTPMEAVLYTAAIANGGIVWKPYLIKEILNNNHKLIYQAFPQEAGKLPVTQDDITIVQEGMHKVVNDPIGSGKRARSDYITLSGKTGTAQVGAPPNRFKNTWFIGYGTFRNKTYAIVISVEHGIAGGMTNAPMARDFFNLWLSEEEAISHKAS